MKKSIILLAYLILSTLIFAQAPEKINYQAVARDLSGNPLINQNLSVTFEIRQGSSSGLAVYIEAHTGVTTNQFGLFTAEIGGGNSSFGTFPGIQWGNGLHYLAVIINGNLMGSSQLLSVPYALYAKESQNGPQGLPGRNSLSLVTTELPGANCSSGGNKIEVGTDDNGNSTLDPFEIDFTYYVCNGDSGSAAGDDWGSQAVQTQGGNISGDGTPSNPLVVINNDNDSTNELQNLTINANTLSITNGNSVTLPTGTTYTAGTAIDLTGNVITNTAPDQIVGIAGAGATSVAGTYPNFTITSTDNVNDADADPTNELQNLTISGNTIGITSGTGINLSPIAPGTGQVLTWNGIAWIAQNAGSGADNWGTQVVVSNTTLTGDGTAGNPLSVNGVLTDNQDLTLTGNTLSLTNDPTTVNLSPYLDNTDAQTLSINANILSITNGNSVTLPNSPTYTAGTGINLFGNVITNTAPDQTVALNNGTGINVTGIYPNFTINNTSPATSTSITGGGLTTVTGTSPNFSVTTPAQTLTYTTPNLTLSNGGGTVPLPTGTVTSVGLAAPTEFSVTGSPITTSGTLGLTWNQQAVNTVFAAPSTAAGIPTFRTLVANDIPNLPATKITTGILPLARGGSNAALTATNGGVVYSTATAMAITPAGTSGYVLQSNGTAAPTWVTPTSLPIASKWTRDNTNGYIYPTMLMDKVGIGTTTPTAKLEILGATDVEAQVRSVRTSGATAIFGGGQIGGTLGTLTNHPFYFKTNSLDRMTIDANGNVGIGTTTPGLISGATKYLSVVNTGPYSSASITSLELKGNTNTGNSASGYVDFINGLTPVSIARVTAITSGSSTGQGQLLFSTNDGVLTERMRITQVGNVGIGVTAPTSKLEVTTNLSNNYVTRITNSNTTNGGTHGVLVSLGVSSPSSSNYYIAMSWGGFIRGTITGNSSTGVMYNTSSDKRLKENISEFNALSLIEKIEPKLYNFIGYDKKEHGFLAQDLQLIYPEAVKGDPNSDPIKDPMMVDYSKLTPLLTGGIKELYQLIKEQQQMIEELKKEVELLKNK